LLWYMQTRDTMVRVVVALTAILTSITIPTALFVENPSTQSTLMGYQAVGILLCYYSVSVYGHVCLYVCS